MARRKGSKKQVTSPTIPPAPPTYTGDQVLLCGELTGVFNNLHLIYNVVQVCLIAKFGQNGYDTEITTVLRTYGTTKLNEQLHALTKIVDSLGGTTRFSLRDFAEDEE